MSIRVNTPTAGELYRLVDRWLDESKVAEAMGDSEDTADTLRECAEELANLLPPRVLAK
jgi:hypothetical protein